MHCTGLIRRNTTRGPLSALLLVLLFYCCSPILLCCRLFYRPLIGAPILCVAVACACVTYYNRKIGALRRQQELQQKPPGVRVRSQARRVLLC